MKRIKSLTTLISILICLMSCCWINSFGQSTKLNSALVSGGDILAFKLTPDGSTVIYIADQDVDEQAEFYRVPIEGGMVTQLSSINDGVFNDFEISPDGNWIVFRRDNSVYSLPITGGAVVQLSDNAHIVDLTFRSVQISPNNDRVVYRTSTSTGGDLYSVPIGGGSVTALFNSSTLVVGSSDFILTPDGSRVIYISSTPSSSGEDLFSISITGGGLIHHDATSSSFTIRGILNDGSRIIYEDKMGVGGQLFSVPINGTTPTALSIAGSGTAYLIVNVYITSDDSRIVYTARQGNADQNEVYSVTPIGTGLIKLNTPVMGTDDAFAVDVSSDGSFVAYEGDHPGSPPDVLYQVDVAGGPITDVSQGQSTSPADFGDVIAPGGERIIYKGIDGRLYSAPSSGSGAIVDLSGPVVSGGEFSDDEGAPKFTSDGGMVIFSGDIEVDNVVELYASPIDEGGTIKLNGPIVNGGDIGSFDISSNNERVVYRADQDTDNVVELYSSILCSASSGSFYTTGVNQVGSAPLALAHAGDQDANTDNQAYILADNNDDIIAINNTEALFMTQLPGDYSVYAINYNDGGVDNLNTGVNISALTGGCFEVSTMPVPITIVPSGDGSVNVSVTH